MTHILTLFDIDGTLVWTGGAGRAALKLALEELFGTAGDLESIEPGGRTFKEIVLLAMMPHRFSATQIMARMAELDAHMADCLARLIDSGAFQVEPCPGTLELIAALQADPRVILGIVTGNPLPTAAIKLEAAGFNMAAFRVGAYGDQTEERSHLVEAAVASGRAIAGAGALERVVVLGDTRRDVEAGRAHDAFTIAVATGSEPYEHLLTVGANCVLHNFADLALTHAIIVGDA